ncbi:MAG: class I SAM-dependent methyltransferase [Planctomycetota bacterium]|nr:class I SAM-dependent methyltransferase [Planctomycetota bacterium]
MKPEALAAHLEEMVTRSHRLQGLLKDREVRFLALAAATMPPALGEVLEIGSFRGLSTTILAHSVRLAGGRRVVAVDPLTLPASTDYRPADAGELPAQFRRTLEENGVADDVEFHRMRSGELARNWHRPLRLLWIDGDHSGDGARADVADFARFVQPGGVIALHDVLHGFDGPVRAFCVGVLAAPWCGPAGVCGSIGWAQRVEESAAPRYAAQRQRLKRRLERLIPYTHGAEPKLLGKLRYKLQRARVPHGDLDPQVWLELTEANLPVVA